MAEEKLSLPQRLLRLPVEIVVALFLVLDEIVAPLFRPIMRWLSSLRIIQSIEEAIGRAPPYLILVLLVLPFGVAELAKVYAVVLMAGEHFRTGVTIFIAAYVVSILVCERIFQAGKGQLMTIGWFKTVYDWVMAIRDKVFGWIKATRAWQAVQDLKQAARDTLRRWKASLGFKPKGTLERP